MKCVLGHKGKPQDYELACVLMMLLPRAGKSTMNRSLVFVKEIKRLVGSKKFLIIRWAMGRFVLLRLWPFFYSIPLSNLFGLILIQGSGMASVFSPRLVIFQKD